MWYVSRLRHEVVAVLSEFVFQEPAQNVLPGKVGTPWPAGIWLGHHRAADVRWATDRGFRAIISIYQVSQLQGPGSYFPAPRSTLTPPLRRSSRVRGTRSTCG